LKFIVFLEFKGRWYLAVTDNYSDAKRIAKLKVPGFAKYYGNLKRLLFPYVSTATIIDIFKVIETNKVYSDEEILEKLAELRKNAESIEMKRAVAWLRNVVIKSISEKIERKKREGKTRRLLSYRRIDMCLPRHIEKHLLRAAKDKIQPREYDFAILLFKRSLWIVWNWYEPDYCLNGTLFDVSIVPLIQEEFLKFLSSLDPKELSKVVKYLRLLDLPNEINEVLTIAEVLG